jgi:cytochrome c
MLKMTTLSLAAAVLLGTAGPAFADGDAAAGEKVFRKCQACHVVQEGVNRVGPSLYGIIGRDAGTVDGFRYSKAMAESGITWTEDQISAYLEDPRGVVKGTRMAFAGLKDEQDRLDVIAYIKKASE